MYSYKLMNFCVCILLIQWSFTHPSTFTFTFTNDPSIPLTTPQPPPPHPASVAGHSLLFSLLLGVVVCNRGIEWPSCSVYSLLSVCIFQPEWVLPTSSTWCSLFYLSCLFLWHVRPVSKLWDRPPGPYLYYSWVLVSHSVTLYHVVLL